jgi:signal transduction histidine kinase/CheY-like chemotaxis protein
VIKTLLNRIGFFLNRTVSDQDRMRVIGFNALLGLSAFASTLVVLGYQNPMFQPGVSATIRKGILAWVLLHIPMYLASRGRHAEKVRIFYFYAAFLVLAFIYQASDAGKVMRLSVQISETCILLFISVLLIPMRRLIEFCAVACTILFAMLFSIPEAFSTPRDIAVTMALASIIIGMWIPTSVLAVLLEFFHRSMAEANKNLSEFNTKLRLEVEKQSVIIKGQQAKVFEAQKMEAIGLLAGGIAHDFNNKLAIIRGYGELIDGSPDDRESVLEWVRNIISAANETSRMTRQLLSFSRQEIIQPRVLNLNSSLKERHLMLSLLAGGQVAYASNFSPELGNCVIDPGQLEQILVNLVANARDAMPDGGRLEVSTCNTTLDSRFASSHPGIQPGPYVTLSITDTGTGMDARTMEHLFEPFFTTKERGKGTGLGLATIYGIVHQNSGCIEVESRAGSGTTFRIHFPRVESEVTAYQSPGVLDSAPAGTETILVVDDEAKIRRLINTILTSKGYRVIEADGPTGAIQASREHQGTIHLLLTDVIMLDGGAKTAVAGITAQRPDIKVLYMSAHADDIITHHGVLDEGKFFIAKPFSSNDLLRKIHEIIHSTGGRARP